MLAQLVAFAVTAVAGFLGLASILELNHAVKLWRSRRVSARDLRTSTSALVDVRGTAQAQSPLLAPLTGKSCVHFTVIMFRDAKKGVKAERDGYPDVMTFAAASPFIVDDGTGRIHVDLREHRVPVTGASVTKKPLERLTAPLEKLLAARLHKPGGVWCMNRAVTATEAALVDGAEVSVVAKRGDNGELRPIHVTTGRARVIALQGLMRAAMGLVGAAVMAAIVVWLRG